MQIKFIYTKKAIVLSTTKSIILNVIFQTNCKIMWTLLLLISECCFEKDANLLPFCKNNPFWLKFGVKNLLIINWRNKFWKFGHNNALVLE